MGLYFSFLRFTPTPLPLSPTSNKCLTMGSSLATLVSTGGLVASASCFAALAFLLYDHVLTFDTEIRLVWNYPGHRFGKGLFLFNRYFGPFTLILNISMYTWPSVSLKVESVAILSVQCILMTRIYAVYVRNRRSLLVLFGMMYVAESVGVLAIPDIAGPPGISTGCYVGPQPPLYFLTWIPPLICESILCLLMLYKAWTKYKNNCDSSLLRLIIRDSVLYFLTVFAIFLINCLVWALASQNYLQVALWWSVALPCSLGSRLMLNMRERIYVSETAQRVSDFTGIESFRVMVPSGLSVESA
ncbi:hypothetical protein JB92DRAFT_2872688 [Gautieria morchelliformis]|nr:hypothetical protein JB92DRAFT_2872688 [Gautieria morchelliformis]